MTTITVTYTPADLEVAITANPTTIGYGVAIGQTTLMVVPYGVPPISLDFPDGVVTVPLKPSGHAVLHRSRPGSTTSARPIRRERGPRPRQ